MRDPVKPVGKLPKLTVDVEEEGWLVSDANLSALKNCFSMKVEGMTVTYGLDEDAFRKAAGLIAEAAIKSFYKGMFADLTDKGLILQLEAGFGGTQLRIPLTDIDLAISEKGAARIAARMKKIPFDKNGRIADGVTVDLAGNILGIPVSEEEEST